MTAYDEAQDLVNAGKLMEAAQHYRTAATMPCMGIDRHTSIWLLARAAKVGSDTQQHDQSKALYEEAIDQSSDAGPLIKGEVLRELGSMYERSNDLNHAAKYYLQVLLEWQKINHATLAESNILLGLAIVELNQGAFDAAEEHLSRAMSIGAHYAPHSLHTLITRSNLGVLYQDQGYFDKAEELYIRTIADASKYFPNSVYLTRVLIDFGLLLKQEGDLARAESYEHKALAIAERRSPESMDVAEVLGILGECALDEGHVLKAEEYQQRALKIRETENPGSIDSADSLAGLGEIARHRGMLIRAEEYYRQSLAIVERVEGPAHYRAASMLGLANILRQNGNLAGAEDLCRQALSIIKEKNPGSIDRVDALGALAKILYSQNRRSDAAEFYQQALLALENQTLHLGRIEGTYSRYRAERIHFYQEYANLLLEQGEVEEAFEIVERARARALSEMLSHSRIDVRQGVDGDLLTRERELRAALNAKSQFRIRLVERTHTESEMKALDIEIGALRESYRQVQAMILASSPAYAALTQPRPLTAKEIQESLLDPDTLLLEYVLGDERSHVFVVSSDSVRAVELPKRSAIEAASRQVYDLLSRRSLRNTDENQAARMTRIARAEDDYSIAAARLSRMTLAPVAEHIGGKRLLIVSDGALHYVPFAALPISLRGKPSVPLAVQNEIVNLPSASVLAVLRRERMAREPAAKTVVVLADPVFDTADVRIVGAHYIAQSKQAVGNQKTLSLSVERLSRSAADAGLLRGRGFYFERLPYTRREAQSIVAAIPNGQAIQALDFQASRALAMSSELARYRIVHFATHGLVDSKHPDLSGLVLSLVNRQGRPQDGFLALEDIYNMKLSADLVVLSACQTALGEQINGEGLIGLTRGFMYAGASRVVASLWAVNDAATAELMAHFYKAMEIDRMRPAAALRQAQLTMWKQRLWHSPYYWAGFQIQGEWK